MVKVGRPLDRERTAVYVLQVKATDGGFPPKSSVGTVEIAVSDINDNPPKCHQKTSKIQVAEDWPEEALLTCLSATDPDAGISGEFRYSYWVNLNF